MLWEKERIWHLMLQISGTAYAHASVRLSLVCEKKEKNLCCIFNRTFPPSSNSVATFPRSAKRQYQYFPAPTGILCIFWHFEGAVQYGKVLSVNSLSAHPSRATCSDPRDVTTGKSRHKCLCNRGKQAVQGRTGTLF